MADGGSEPKGTAGAGDDVDVEVSSNPIRMGTGAAPTLADLETALEGLQAQTVTPAEVVRVMDGIYQRQWGLTATVRTIFSHLTIAPTNWHQGTVYFLANPADAALGFRGCRRLAEQSQEEASGGASAHGPLTLAQKDRHF